MKKYGKKRIIFFGAAVSILILCSLFANSIIAVNRTISDTQDDVFGYIIVKKGLTNITNYFPANEEGVQQAINSLNNETGEVDGNWNSIDLSKSIKLSSNIKFHSFIFNHADNTKFTMIRNYDSTNGNPNIRIYDIIIEGNGINQVDEDSSYLMYDQNCGIFLIKCDDAKVVDVSINNTQFGGLFFKQSQNNIAERVTVTKAGYQSYVEEVGIAQSGGVDDRYSAVGIYFYNCTDGVMYGCIVNNTRSAGLVIEGYLEPASVEDDAWRSRNITVSDCIVTNASQGLYFEDARDCYVTNCIFKDGGQGGAPYYKNWANPYGIKIYNSTSIKITNCGIEHVSRGVNLQGQNITIDNCKFTDIGYDFTAQGYGIEAVQDIYHNRDRITITNCLFYNVQAYGIYSTYMIDSIINTNTFYGGCSGGNGIRLVNSDDVTIGGNVMTLPLANYGVYLSTGCDNIHIGSGNILDAIAEVYMTGANSYYMHVNASTQKIGITTASGTRWI